MHLQPRRAALVATLIIEALVAGWLRWPLTQGDIKTEFEYQLGQVVITSASWQRAGGAATKYFMPSRSIDQYVAEWPYADQNYVTVPPLSFALHYAATRVWPRADPVLLAKLIAQIQIALAIIITAFFLLEAFGFWPTVLGLSFAMWSVPFLVWFINGYFSTTTAVAVHLVFASWSVAWLKRRLETGAPPTRFARIRAIVAAAVLATLGAMADTMGLAVNGVIALVLVACALSRRRPRTDTRGAMPIAAGYHARKEPERTTRTDTRGALPIAAAILASSAGVVAGVVALYRAGSSAFLTQFLDRFKERTGLANQSMSLVGHLLVVKNQMLRAWPVEILAAVSLMLLALVAWMLVGLVTKRRRTTRELRAPIVLTALVVGFVPSLLYHYTLQAHVAIHWWFSGTWTVGWTLTICCFIALVRDELCARLGAIPGTVAYRAVCVGLLVTSIAVNVRHDDLGFWARYSSGSYPANLLRELGRQLPADGDPIVAAGVSDLFRQYPFTTAYVRRPVLLLDANGDLKRPAGTDPPSILHFQMSRHAYVVFDSDETICSGEPVLLKRWRFPRVSVCRASTELLATAPDRVVRPAVRLGETREGGHTTLPREIAQWVVLPGTAVIEGLTARRIEPRGCRLLVHFRPLDDDTRLSAIVEPGPGLPNVVLPPTGRPQRGWSRGELASETFETTEERPFDLAVAAGAGNAALGPWTLLARVEACRVVIAP